jgi:hypothetical protein
MKCPNRVLETVIDLATRYDGTSIQVPSPKQEDIEFLLEWARAGLKQRKEAPWAKTSIDEEK